MTDDHLPPGVAVEQATTAAADTVADLWVDLAEGQRAHGSHLASEGNRPTAREEAARHAVTGGLFVARGPLPDGGDDDGGPDGEATDAGGNTDRDATGDSTVGGGAGDEEDVDTVLGFVTASVETTGYQQDVDRGLVQNLYVRPEVRGRGIGAALLDAAERHLRERGVDRVALEAMADNAAARRFYRRHGYTEHRVELEKPVGDR